MNANGSGKPAEKRRKHWWYGSTFRTRIIILFVLVLYGTVGALGSFVFYGWFQEMRHAISQTASWQADEVSRRLDGYLDIPGHLVEVHHDLIETGVVNIADPATRERFFASALRTHQGSSVLSFSVGFETGEYYGARWNPRGEVEAYRNDASTGGASWYYAVNPDGTAAEKVMEAGLFDPRARDWYLVARQTNGLVHSPIYSHFVTRDLAISAARQLVDVSAGLDGVLAAHITLGQISAQLAEASVETGTRTLVVERQTGLLVANTLNTENAVPDGAGGLARRPLTEEIHAGFTQVYRAHVTDGVTVDRMRDDAGLNTVLVTAYRRPGIDWLILTAVPEAMFTRAPYLRLGIAALSVLLLLAGASVLFIRMANRYLRPVRDLIQASADFSAGDLARRAPVARHDEIGEMAHAFNGMADTISAQVTNLEEQVRARTRAWEAANRTLEESEDRLRLILDSTAEAIYGLDHHGRCTFCNASALQLLGYESEAALLGRNMHEAIHHRREDGTPFNEMDCPITRAFLDKVGVHVPEDVFWRADGTAIEVAYHAYPQQRDGEVVGVVVSFIDISQSKQAQARIQYLGTHDALTGLFNRPAFDEAMRRAEREAWVPVSILFGDVNGLKLTNDIFGHEAGDELLRVSAEILTAICREEDTVARVGGDEFTVLLPYTGAQGAQHLCDRILEAFSQRTVSSIRCSISIGTATRTDAQTRLEDVLKQAEENMYKAKALERRRNDNTLIGTLMETLFNRAPDERRHAEAVGRISVRLGQALNLSEPELRRLRETARLHDIGKIVLDDEEIRRSELWFQDGDLSAAEGPVEARQAADGADEARHARREMLQRHVLVGYRILNLSSDTLDLAENVLAHHEHWDGTGYPKGLKGEEIPLAARILLMAEYVADLTNGPGRDRMAAETLPDFFRAEAGQKFDPALVAVILPLLEAGALA
jgi:diguanylate cyclase (GGDEF)-like protein/PAS domain S-box-containing protein